MYRLGLFLVGLLFLLFPMVSLAQAKPVDVYLFYSSTCPHCEREQAFFDEYESENPGVIDRHEYEVTGSNENRKLFIEAARVLGDTRGSVPFLVVGEELIVGYGSEDTTGAEIKRAITFCQTEGCNNVVGNILAARDITPTPKPTPIPGDQQIEVPFFGIINLTGIPLPLTTIIIAFIDGFNPCAMWVLVFLLTLLINLQDRRKLWILGGTFILVSGMVYFLFLAAWLSVFQILGFINWLRYGIALFALVTGIYHIKKYYDTRPGCATVGEEKRERILDRARKIVASPSLIVSLIGIVGLAITVNMFELACSAGLPAIYTQILSLATISPPMYFFYLVLYVIIFMLDDLIVFAIAVTAFKMTGISAKYTRVVSLVGGIVMIVIGILLLLRPQILTGA